MPCYSRTNAAAKATAFAGPVTSTSAPVEALRAGAFFVRDAPRMRIPAAAGSPSLEVICIAAAQSARTPGIGERIGTLRASRRADLLLVDGKPDEDIAQIGRTLRASRRADLLLVDGKPDEDIAQIGRIDLVFRNGIAYDPSRLRESVRGKIGR